MLLPALGYTLSGILCTDPYDYVSLLNKVSNIQNHRYNFENGYADNHDAEVLRGLHPEYEHMLWLKTGYGLAIVLRLGPDVKYLI